MTPVLLQDAVWGGMRHFVTFLVNFRNSLFQVSNYERLMLTFFLWYGTPDFITGGRLDSLFFQQNNCQEILPQTKKGRSKQSCKF